MKSNRWIFWIIGMAWIAGVLRAEERLTLSQCLALAKQHNLTLQRADWDVRSAEAGRSEAFTHYFPEVSASVMAFQAFDKLIKGDGLYPEEIAMFGEQYAALVGQPFSVRALDKGYSATLSAVQPLFSGGRIVAANKLAAIQQEVACLQRSITKKEVLQQVTECFWQAATMRYNLQTLDMAEKQVEAMLNETQNQVNAGVATRNAILRVKLRQQELASERLQLENAEQVLLMLLAQQIGLADERITIDISQAEPTDPSTLYASAEERAERREELLMAGQGVAAQQWQIRMERGKHLPSLAVGVMGVRSDFGGLPTEVKAMVKTDMTNGLVFGTLSIPLTAWWGGKHAIRLQRIKLRQAELDYQNTRENLRIEIESAWSSLVEAYQQIALKRQSVEEATENFRMSSEQYRAGTENLTELLDAETLQRSAQNQLSSALADYQVRLADYRRKTATED